MRQDVYRTSTDWPRDTKKTSHTNIESNRSMCDTHLVIFLAKSYKADIAHRNRIESVAHLRARNPRFYFVHAGTKTHFLTKNGHQKSGIPCSGTSSSTSRQQLTRESVPFWTRARNPRFLMPIFGQKMGFVPAWTKYNRGFRALFWTTGLSKTLMSCRRLSSTVC
jgi:hypothetical protein